MNKRSRCPFSLLGAAACFNLIPQGADAFTQSKLLPPPSFHHRRTTRRSTSLPYATDALRIPTVTRNDTDFFFPTPNTNTPFFAREIDDTIQNEERRMALKKELAKAAITDYDSRTTGYAEQLMSEIEQLRPWSRPAYHPKLNARWTFVFTGVPTIGMKLITILSKLSMGIPILDFKDCFLEVREQNTFVNCVVQAALLGMPLDINVFTNLKCDDSCEDGTMMFEHFQGARLLGVDLPVPDSWKKTRTLAITYLDEDMMIARTSGGEPHLLIRLSPCSSDDEECDVENSYTNVFEEARQVYGDRITRCLVDRNFGQSQEVS